MLLDPVRETYLREFMIEAATSTPTSIRSMCGSVSRRSLDLGRRLQGGLRRGAGRRDGRAAPAGRGCGDGQGDRGFGRPQENYGGGLFGRLIALNRAAQPQGRRFLEEIR